MPILVRSSTPTQPSGPGHKPPRVEERLDVTWYAPDGSVWPLTVPAGTFRAQATNALSKATPVEITTDPNPRGGVDVRHVQPLEQYLILPVLVRCSTHMELAEAWRDLGDAFTQTEDLGPGVLRVTQPNGSWRDIEAVFWSGWEGIAEQGWDWDIAPALTLMAPCPWWRGPAGEPVRRDAGTGTPFLAPFMTVSSGRVLGDTVITNPGQVKAWPEWTITGPLTSLTAINKTTGEQFVLDPNWDGGGPLGSGKTVTISTDPFRVRGPTGEIWTGAISGSLWGLARRDNKVTFSAAGSSAGTAIELTYRPLYRTA